MIAGSSRCMNICTNVLYHPVIIVDLDTGYQPLKQYDRRFISLYEYLYACSGHPVIIVDLDIDYKLLKQYDRRFISLYEYLYACSVSFCNNCRHSSTVH
jgi:hypothetical protein